MWYEDEVPEIAHTHHRISGEWDSPVELALGLSDDIGFVPYSRWDSYGYIGGWWYR